MPTPNSIRPTTTATTIAVLMDSMMTGPGFQYVPLLGRYKPMSNEDKLKNKIEDLGGRAKEAVGKATGDDDTKNEGRGDQAKSSLKDAGEKVKDAFKK
jgi:uncharacterized protein YjbJ (UPF0337 family)